MRDFFARHDLALRLPVRFDPGELRQDLERMDPEWWRRHLGPYHDGLWEMIALRSPGGDMKNQTTRGGPFEDTDAARLCRHLTPVLRAFPGELNRVRYMRLRPGGRILPHSDPMHQVDPRLIRIHVPVITNDRVEFAVHGQRLSMRPGEAWFVDVRFRHAVTNGGDQDRVHLVIDVLRNEAMEALIRASESAGRGWLTPYFLKHSLPGRVRRWAGIGN